MPQGIPVPPNPPGSLLSALPATDTVGGTITAVSVAGPTQLTFAADHGLQTGASITVAGTATTPTTVGTFVVTVVDSTHVTIPVTVTVVTTGTGTATARTLVQQVLALPTKGALTDRSGTITAGGTAQVAAAANSARAYLLLQNVDAGETLWYSLTGTAAPNGAGSYQLGPGQAFAMESRYVSTQALSVVAATTGHQWTASEG